MTPYTTAQLEVIDRLLPRSKPVRLHCAAPCSYTSTLILKGRRFPICSRCGNGVRAAYETIAEEDQ